MAPYDSQDVSVWSIFQDETEWQQIAMYDTIIHGPTFSVERGRLCIQRKGREGANSTSCWSTLFILNLNGSHPTQMPVRLCNRVAFINARRERKELLTFGQEHLHRLGHDGRHRDRLATHQGDRGRSLGPRPGREECEVAAALREHGHRADL